jgi:hypothetical protein
MGVTFGEKLLADCQCAQVVPRLGELIRPFDNIWQQAVGHGVLTLRPQKGSNPRSRARYQEVRTLYCRISNIPTGPAPIADSASPSSSGGRVRRAAKQQIRLRRVRGT